MRKLRSFLVPVLTIALLNGVFAQGSISVIERGTVLNGELEALGTQRYSLDMEAGAWAVLRVNQLGVDIAITTYDPTGNKLTEYDSPNGAYGPELVRLNASVPGTYGIEVRSIEAGAARGAYELQMLAAGAKPRTAAEEMDAFLAHFNTSDAPGLAIAVMKNGEDVYHKCFGMADLEHRLPISPSTVFHVASVSKQFTAFAMLLLVQEGRLSLEDDVRKYIPELPVYAQPITICDLAQHTSGLRDIDDILQLSGVAMEDQVTNAEALHMIMRQSDLNFTPGTAFEYSNSGFMLLAEVVSRVVGKPFSAFAAERIFTPLGMTNTRVLDIPGTVVENKAYSYGLDGIAYVERPVNSTAVGASGINTTVEDLCRWARNFETPIVGDRPLIDRTQRSGALANGEPISYALGLDHKNYKGQHVIFHGGGDAGFRANLVRIPEHRFVVAITSNAQDFNPVEAAERAIDFFLADEMKAAAPKPAVKKPRRSNYDALTGDYEIFPGLVFSVSRADAELQLRVSGNPAPIVIDEVGENEFQMGNVYNRLTFHIAADGRADKLNYHIYDFTWRGPRVALRPVDPAANRSAEFTGRYLSKELGVAISVSVSDSVLVVSGHRNGPIPMEPFQPDEFRTSQGYIGHMAFVRDENGVITGCVVSGNRAKGILFERLR